jgi:hypothetical protein
MPELTDIPKELANVARDTTYVVVGLGVLGVQRSQVRRQELQRWLEKQDFSTGSLETHVSTARTELAKRAITLDDLLEQAIEQVETSLQPLEAQLPEPARDVVAKAHSQGREVRGYIRQRVHSVA